MTDASILVVDDNKNVLTALDMLLSREFTSVVCINKPGQILSELERGKFGAVLLDMNYTADQKTGNEGLYWLSKILNSDEHLSVVMITAFGDIQLAVNAIKDGAVDFVLKPWDNQKIRATMRTAVQLTQSKRKVVSLQKDKDNLKAELKGKPVNLIGKSRVFSEVLTLVQRVAATPADVLITGENGTGKELIARELHRLSERSGEILVTVDLGAIPETLFESELFGHVKGAFTDAHVERCGKIEAAHGGTLFFDEIGNLTLPLQAKLLSVLQNRSISRVGSLETIPVDVRLVCATNMDLNAMVEEGSFRMDLLYRINTIQVEIPPLRERGDDLLLLAAYFLHLFSGRYNKPGLIMDESAENALRKWRWPGNVRELQHCMERAVILTDGKTITERSFQFNTAANSSSASYEGTLEDIEARLFQYAIRKHNGNMTAVAAQLGISRQTLYNKIKKYGL